MNREELRLGNLVCFKNVFGVTKDLNVSSIESGGVRLLTGARVDGFGICTEVIKYEEIHPIKITEQILLGCGFEKIPHFTITNLLMMNIGRGRHLSIGCAGTPNEMVSLYYQDDESGKKIDDVITVWNYDYDKHLHLHQLQNLFYALTGTELNVENYGKV